MNRHPIEAPNRGARPSWLTFRLGSQNYAVTMRQVARVAEVEALHPVPGDLECNLGLTVHDGVVLGVLDLEILLEVRTHHRRPRAPFTCIFGRFARGIAGFPVDELLGLERTDEAFSVVDLGSLEASR